MYLHIKDAVVLQIDGHREMTEALNSNAIPTGIFNAGTIIFINFSVRRAREPDPVRIGNFPEIAGALRGKPNENEQ